MTSGVVVTLLALLLGLQAVASDLYLPGLPQLTQELGADMRGAQYTLSGMLLAFGLSQLIWGPLSDRFGRWPVLLAGMGGFALASIGGERYSRDVLVKVADAYVGQAEYERAIDTFGFLIALEPEALGAAAWQRKVVET